MICNFRDYEEDHDSTTKDDSRCFCEELPTCLQKILALFRHKALNPFGTEPCIARGSLRVDRIEMKSREATCLTTAGRNLSTTAEPSVPGLLPGAMPTAKVVSVRGYVLLVFSHILYGSFPSSPENLWGHHPIVKRSNHTYTGLSRENGKSVHRTYVVMFTRQLNPARPRHNRRRYRHGFWVSLDRGDTAYSEIVCSRQRRTSYVEETDLVAENLLAPVREWAAATATAVGETYCNLCAPCAHALRRSL